MPGSGPLVAAEDVPGWLRDLVAATADIDPEVFGPSRLRPPAGSRPAAVLILFGEDTEGKPDVLLLRRAETLGSHAGQVAFPGGAAEEGDGGPVGTALREAAEETGLAADGIRPLATLPPLYVPASGFAVTPVMAHWREPSPVHAVDPAETAAVARVPIASLLDPGLRCAVRVRPDYVSPAFLAPGMLIWVFTALLLTTVLRLGGWDSDWDTSDVRPLEQAWHDARRLPRQPDSPCAARCRDGGGVHGIDGGRR
jgi:8-oxo-dGTP pyrophosphatase MutT (NUDIX family)